MAGGLLGGVVTWGGQRGRGCAGAWLLRTPVEAQGRTDLKAELGRGGANVSLWVEDEDAGTDLGGKVDLDWCGAARLFSVLY